MNNGAASSSSLGPSSGPSSASHGNGNPYDEPRYTHDDADADELDLLGDDDATTVLRDDPLQTDLSSPLTFKRKQKQPGFLSQPARLLSSLTGRALNSSHNAARSTPNLPPSPPPPPPLTGASTRLDPLSPTKDPSSSAPHPHDWYAEGPGRRVGYEDLTAIDWIFEYTKERQRQRALRAATTTTFPPNGSSSGSGSGSAALQQLLGYAQRLLDASQVWVVLLLTGLAVGALAAAIDVATDWLGDVKDGFCSSAVDGGRFYLSRSACCFGYEESSHCRGWRRWGVALLGRAEGGGVWVVEYVVYLVLAVGIALGKHVAGEIRGGVCWLMG
jgi:chloride channel 3/4/5